MPGIGRNVMPDNVPPGADQTVPQAADAHGDRVQGGDRPGQQKAQTSTIDAAATASQVLNGAASWFSRVGSTAREYAAVAGQRLDQAADSINNTVDQYAQQVCTLVQVASVVGCLHPCT